MKKNALLYSLAISTLLLGTNVEAQTPEAPKAGEEKVKEATQSAAEKAAEDARATAAEVKVEVTPVVVPSVAVAEKKVVIEKPVVVETPVIAVIPVPGEPTIEYSPEVEIRLRGNYHIFGDTFHNIGMRERVGLRASYETLKVHLQVQDSRSFGQTAKGFTDGSITTGIHQGYFEIGDKDMWFRAGRQEISYGSQRMIGSLNGSNAARAFDALRFHTSYNDLQVDLFGATLNNQQAPIEGNYVTGFYMTYQMLENITLEKYILFRHNETSAAKEDISNIASFGLRSAGTSGALGYDIEGDFQIGKNGENDHLAYAVAAQLFYSIDASVKPKMGFGFAYASGQSVDGKTSEFNNFFPTNHKFYGQADLIGWRNIMQGEFNIAMKPTDKISAKLNVLPTMLADPDGRWSNAGGKTVGDGLSTEAFLGTEIDFNAGWKPRKYFSLSGGYSLFLPAKGGEDRLGSSDPIHYLYIMTGVNLK